MDHRITALKVQKYNPVRVNVHLDGEYAFGLSRIVAAWLEVGQELSDEKIAVLQTEDERESAYQRALRFLKYQVRCEAEVRRNLFKHGISGQIVDETIDRLKNNGLLDDQQFAFQWIENRSDHRPRSRRALAYELTRRGLDQETISIALESVADNQLAYQSALKQGARYKDLEKHGFQRKMLAYLSQKGFDYETSRTAVQSVWEKLEEENSPPDKEVLS